MAQQKAQAQLTIIDTNDIQRIYVVYAKSTTNSTAPSAAASTWTESISSAPGSGNYIWQRTVVEQSGTHALSYGNPICVTGPAGTNARNITSVTPYYYLSTSNSAPTGGSWSTTPQTYPSSGTYYYWTKTITAYDSGNSTESTAVLDMIITNAAKDARDANLIAATANSIAQHANEDAQGAMSQAAANIQIITRLWYAKANSTAPSAPSTHVTTASATTYNSWNTIRPNSNDSYPYYFYCDETCTGGGVYSWSVVTLDTSNLSQYQIGLLNTQVKNFWWDSSGAHIASGIGSNNVTKGTVSTYGYNTLIALDGISFKYNDAKVVNLNSTTPSLDFYKPPTISGNTVTEGAKTISLTGSALKFYGSSTSTADVELNSNGLNITNGFIQLGGTDASGTADGNIRLSNTNFTRSINNISRDYLRLAIGSNFGVKNDGTLYASNANVSGTIIVGDGSNVYSQEETDSQLYGTYVYQYSHIVDSQEVIEDVYLKDDGTYYYLDDGIEVVVLESSLMVDENNNLIKIPKGGLSETLNSITDSIDSINTTLSNTEDNSLYARGYASFSNDKLILYKKQNDNIKSALELTSDAVVLKVEEIEVASMRSSGTMGIMKATNMEQSYVKMINSSGTGLYQWIAQSDGHLSLKKL